MRKTTSARIRPRGALGIGRRSGLVFALLVCSAGLAVRALASTYVVYIPLDSPIYDELDTLNSLGMLETYLQEVKPISRVEAARLTLEAERMIGDATQEGKSSAALPLARTMAGELRAELVEEIGWLENDSADDQPTMVVPIERAEAQYVYSSGRRRGFGPKDKHGEQLRAVEATPLLPDNDDLPTSVANNEVMRTSGWLGLHEFFTAYGEGAIAGPLGRSPVGISGTTRNHVSLLRGEAVADFGNAAVSFGQQEMYWGTGRFGSLSQGDNARPFPALRVESVHPSLLPGFLKYLGPFRGEAFFGELDHDRLYAYPWLSGQIIVFKPLSTFELGLTHVIMFGGRGNAKYDLLGFLGRATGLSPGNAHQGNTHAEGGFTTKFYLPSLRNSYLYLDVLGTDNLSTEVRYIGHLLPFAGVSYQGGIYVPRVTSDGLTMARLEFVNTSQRYGFHSDSLYWTHRGRLMGNPVGPDAFQINLAIGRWLNRSFKLDVDYFHTERDPELNPKPGVDTEYSNGMSFELMRLPRRLPAFLRHESLGMDAYLACEWVHNLNTVSGSNNFRAALRISFSLYPTSPPLKWH